MKQGVFWLIDNKLLAIPFDKSKYPDGIAKSGDTYNHEKLWKYVKPQNCNKPYNYYPRGRVVKGTKNKYESGYIKRVYLRYKRSV